MFSNAAHKAERHSAAFPSKAAARQNRLVELELNYSRPTARDQNSRRRGRPDAAPSPVVPATVSVVDQIDFGGGGGPGGSSEVVAPDMSDESFPTLGGASSSSSSSALDPADSLARKLVPSSGYATSWADGKRLPKEEDFPSLPGASASAPQLPLQDMSRKKPQQQQQRKPKTREEEFPSLGGPSQEMPSFRLVVSSSMQVSCQASFANSIHP